MTASSDNEPQAGPPGGGAGEGGRAALHRTPRQKVVAGVCGGLGRYCDVDPVIFRVVIGVLAAAGGLGLIFYAFAWLLIPMEGEEEAEGRRMLSGRVDGAALSAVLLALVGCGLFLSMVGNGGTLSFAIMLSLAVAGSAVWSQRRRATAPGGGPMDPATAHVVAEAPPETTAPPVPGGPSWWRDPIVKDGTAGPSAAPYLWGPDDTAGKQPHDGSLRARIQERLSREEWQRPRRSGQIGGLAWLAAVGTGVGLAVANWQGHPLGTVLELALGAAVGVLGLGLFVSAFAGRTDGGTIFVTALCAVLLAGAAALPKDIGTHWTRHTWRPAAAGAVLPGYEAGTGLGTLDLRGVDVPAGHTVHTSMRASAGQLTVFVPAGVTVDLSTRTTAADVRLPNGDGGHRSHLAVRETLHRTLPPPVEPGVPRGGTVAIRLDVEIGQVVVERAAP